MARKRKSFSDTFLVNGEKCTDKVKIANEFCSFFSDIGKQYDEAILRPLNTPESYLRNAPNPSTMYFTPTVIKIIQSFKTKKSTGDDGISMHLLKQLCQSCCLPITNLINLSLEQGIVPDAMKLAKIIPIQIKVQRII